MSHTIQQSTPALRSHLRLAVPLRPELLFCEFEIKKHGLTRYAWKDITPLFQFCLSPNISFPPGYSLPRNLWVTLSRHSTGATRFGSNMCQRELRETASCTYGEGNKHHIMYHWDALRPPNSLMTWRLLVHRALVDWVDLWRLLEGRCSYERRLQDSELHKKLNTATLCFWLHNFGEAKKLNKHNTNWNLPKYMLYWGFQPKRLPCVDFSGHKLNWADKIQTCTNGCASSQGLSFQSVQNCGDNAQKQRGELFCARAKPASTLDRKIQTCHQVTEFNWACFSSDILCIHRCSRSVSYLYWLSAFINNCGGCWPGQTLCFTFLKCRKVFRQRINTVAHTVKFTIIFKVSNKQGKNCRTTEIDQIPNPSIYTGESTTQP